MARGGLSWQNGDAARDTARDTAAPERRFGTLSPKRSCRISGSTQVSAAKTVWVQEQHA